MINDHIDPDTAHHLQRLTALGYRNPLVAAYVDLQLQRDDISSLGDVLAEINVDLGVNYKTQRLMDWRNGSAKCPAHIANYMRRCLLQYLFADEAAERLAVLLDI